MEIFFRTLQSYYYYLEFILFIIVIIIKFIIRNKYGIYYNPYINEWDATDYVLCLPGNPPATMVDSITPTYFQVDVAGNINIHHVTRLGLLCMFTWNSQS